MGFLEIFESIIDAFSNDKSHVYKGKSGWYYKSGSKSSGRKGKTLLFKSNKKK